MERFFLSNSNKLVFLFMLICFSCYSQDKRIEVFAKVKSNYTIKKVMVRWEGELGFKNIKNHKEIKRKLKGCDRSSKNYSRYRQNKMLSYIIPISIGGLSIYSLNALEERFEDMNFMLSFMAQSSLIVSVACTPINYLTYREKSNIKLIKCIKNYNDGIR